MKFEKFKNRILENEKNKLKNKLAIFMFRYFLAKKIKLYLYSILKNIQNYFNKKIKILIEFQKKIEKYMKVDQNKTIKQKVLDLEFSWTVKDIYLKIDNYINLYKKNLDKLNKLIAIVEWFWYQFYELYDDKKFLESLDKLKLFFNEDIKIKNVSLDNIIVNSLNETNKEYQKFFQKYQQYKNNGTVSNYIEFILLDRRYIELVDFYIKQLYNKQHNFNLEYKIIKNDVSK